MQPPSITISPVTPATSSIAGNMLGTPKLWRPVSPGGIEIHLERPGAIVLGIVVVARGSVGVLPVGMQGQADTLTRIVDGMYRV